ncbi:unnamed protein product [Brassica rapa subsp. trilocularis]
MLHRLPSKNVVATSVLSKRWRSLWKEVNRFSYDGGTVGREYWRFALFISKLSNLESLDLKISPYRTNKFINYLVNIEKAQSRHDRFSNYLKFEDMPELVKASVSVDVLPPLNLNDAPRLRVLKLNLFRKHCVQSWNQPSSVPECLSSHLEILEWRQYKGTETEIESAKYILANGNWRLTLFLTFDVVACLWTNILVTREMRKQNFIDGRLNAENNILIDVIIMNISILRIIITQLKPSAELRPFLVGYNLYHTSTPPPVLQKLFSVVFFFLVQVLHHSFTH